MNCTAEDIMWVRFMRIWLRFSEEEIAFIREMANNPDPRQNIEYVYDCDSKTMVYCSDLVEKVKEEIRR